jgi:tetratricopeptide (TPR) repeat protein
LSTRIATPSTPDELRDHRCRSNATSLGGTVPNRVSVPILLGWSVVVATISYSVLLGSGNMDWVFARLISLALIAIGLGSWFLLIVKSGSWKPRSTIWPVLVSVLAAMVVVTATSSYWRLSLEYLAWTVLAVALYLLFVRLVAWEWVRRRVPLVAAMLALAVGFMYVGAVGIEWLQWWTLLGRLDLPPLRPSRLDLTFSSPNVVAMVSVSLAAIALVGWGDQLRVRRGWTIGILLLTAAVVLLSGSRGAWLASVVALLAVVLVWWWRHRRPIQRVPWVSKRRAFGCSLLAALVTALVFPVVASRIAEGDGGRMVYAITAARMFQADPLTGLGLGSWSPQRLQFTDVGELDYYVAHAHNVYLQVLAESGLVGVVAGAAGIIVVVLLIAAGLRETSGERYRWSWAALFLLVFAAVSNLFGFMADKPGVVFLIVVPIAVLDATATSMVRTRLPPRWSAAVGRTATLALFVACLVALGGLGHSESVALTHQRAVWAANEGDWLTASHLAAEAYAADREMPAYALTLGLASLWTGDWQMAHDSLEQAVRADDLPQSWLGLASAKVELGRSDEEVAKALRSALRIGVQQPAVALAAGSLFDRIGMRPEADAAYVAALAKRPSIGGDTWWRDRLLGPARFDRLLRAAVAQPQQSGWELALMSGSLDLADSLEGQVSDPYLADLIGKSWAGDASAVTSVRDYALARPRDERALGWAARVSAHAGDGAWADKLRALARVAMDAPVDALGFETRVVQVASSEVLTGSLGRTFGGVVYRRPTPIDLLPPGVPRLITFDLASSADG